MKRSAALNTFFTAWILFAVVGIQYSVDQQKRAALFTQNQSQVEAASKLDDGIITIGSLNREKRVLGGIAMVAVAFLAASLAMYRKKVTEPRQAAPALKKAA